MIISDRTTQGWHSDDSIVPPEKSRVLISHDSNIYIGYWEELEDLSKNEFGFWHAQWKCYGPDGLTDIDSPVLWMDIKSPLLDSDSSKVPLDRKASLEYLHFCLTAVLELMSRIEMCDRSHLNNEFTLEVKEVIDATKFLNECVNTSIDTRF